MNNKAFTLIEVIITLIVLAILAAMMVPFFGTSFTKSAAPVSRLNKSLTLGAVMEKITAEYAEVPHWRAATTYGPGALVLPTAGVSNGYRYYTTAGGTSASSEPSAVNDPANPWPTAAGSTVTDGGIVWTRDANCAPTLLDSSCSRTDCTCPAGLKGKIGPEGNDYDDPKFGRYRVIDNHFINFDAANTEYSLEAYCLSNPKDGKCRYLKVTIGFRSDDSEKTGETLTTLFVRRW